MRKITLLLALILLLSCVTVSAKDLNVPGEVLYHQDFSEISDIKMSGIKIGTQSTAEAFVDCPKDSLQISMYNKGRAYLILPHVDRPDTYTVEFDFTFEGHESENGYIAFILNCRGDEPTNISSVVIRHSGIVDDFETPDPALSEAISSGKTVKVSIPVENNVLYRIVMTVGEDVYTLSRDKVLVLSNEEFGLAARHTNVNIREIFVVSGTGYSEKSGYYAENSFATNENSVIPDGDYAPNTSDDMPIIVWVFAGSVVALILFAILGKKRK